MMGSETLSYAATLGVMLGTYLVVGLVMIGLSPGRSGDVAPGRLAWASALVGVLLPVHAVLVHELIRLPPSQASLVLLTMPLIYVFVLLDARASQERQRQYWFTRFWTISLLSIFGGRIATNLLVLPIIGYSTEIVSGAVTLVTLYAIGAWFGAVMPRLFGRR